MKANDDQALRDHLLELLKGGHAHATFDAAIADFPSNLRGRKADDLPYTAWMLLEHLRIAQWDILEFSHNAKHKSPDWPSGYWPKEEAPPSTSAWTNSIRTFEKDMKAMQSLVADPKSDLYAPFPWGEGQTLLREALLVAD